ncbi:MAG TPA: hypothetical protein VKA67_07020 [Verrucomicrobiae bacterium]|nr:hypothetical protein [Verrucomicrobiae bacterium]
MSQRSGAWRRGRRAENLDMEVDGVAGQVSLRPAPVAVLDDETGIGGQNKIARLARDELEAALLEQRRQRGGEFALPAR